MPRLLILCEYPTLNGGERSMLATLPGVRAAGFEPLVAAPAEGPLAEALRSAGVARVPLAVSPAGEQRPSQSRRREELAAVIARTRPDLLHANSLAMGRLSGPVAAAAGVASLAHLRDIIGLSARAAADLNCHARLLAVSAAVRVAMVAEGLDAGRTHVLHNGVDLAQFAPCPASGALHRELGLPASAVLVGTIGQICLRKGQDVLVRAAAAVAARRGDVHWLVIGQRHSDKDESRRFEAELRRAADEPPLAGRMHFLGRRDDVAGILNELALVVHPARQEPLGRVLLEAAAAGAAVIATDVGGTREIFPAESGAAWLVGPDDPAAIAEAITTLLDDPARRRRMQAAARARAEEGFALDRATAGLVANYRAALG